MREAVFVSAACVDGNMDNANAEATSRAYHFYHFHTCLTPFINLFSHTSSILKITHKRVTINDILYIFTDFK